MEPLRIGPLLPPIVGREEAVARPETRPNLGTESAAPSTPESSGPARVFQPSAGDEVLIAFESGVECRMPNAECRVPSTQYRVPTAES